MISYINYKGCGIEYFAGITQVIDNGSTIKRFNGFGEIEGTAKAKKYIDEIILKEDNMMLDYWNDYWDNDWDIFDRKYS